LYILGQMAGERIIAVSSKDYALFQKLQGEVGTLDNPMVTETEGAGNWYSQDLESSEMAVRGVMRRVTLERLGYQEKGGVDWIADAEDISTSLDSNPEIKSALGDPNYMHYKWQRVSAKDMGGFTDMHQDANNGPAVDAQNGVVLFSDEIKQLADGQVVTTLHSSGFGMGFLIEMKEVYKVVDGNLQRIRAKIVD